MRKTNRPVSIGTKVTYNIIVVSKSQVIRHKASNLTSQNAGVRRASTPRSTADLSSPPQAQRLVGRSTRESHPGGGRLNADSSPVALLAV